ncbi:ferritin-like domain-containing protein [Sulfurimonas sp. HSL3-7]|uniref:ferritin-like domain-containing protein n=1 Tax=Sulfonitrofixus jiaomeiensis TaxID=3131938 RepID=UPI0031F7D03C
MNFYKSLETILTTDNPSEKFEAFHRFYARYRAGEVKVEERFEPVVFTTPSYASFCKIVPPQTVPKRRKVSSDEGKIILLHAIAHIEYSAIDLALDHAYRFQGLPKAYYDDWLEVAEDEIRHFEMLNTLLEELGAKYGDVAVHNSLFEASERTQTLVERMAVIPRYLEANGLDATPQVLERLERLPSDPMLERIKAALRTILAEEVDHVLKGDRWFHYACDKAGVPTDIFFEIIQAYYPGSFPKQQGVNVKARQEAGFSCAEMKKILDGYACPEP